VSIPKNARRLPTAARNPSFKSGHYSRFAWFGWRGSSLLVVFLGLYLFSQLCPVQGENTDPATVARQGFYRAKLEYQGNSRDVEAAWRFARAAFDLGDLATNSNERADIAQQGIAACKQALANNPGSAPLHYYLGLNQGQLARTRGLSALKLVDQMELEFTRAIELDASFDYAGPDRTLGLLYRDAPALGSIGSRPKARVHLQRAVELVPNYPENRLSLIETELKWGDRKQARQELKQLEDAWSAAQTEFAGPAWARSWTDWNARLYKIKNKLPEPAPLDTLRH
jgi:tetratricopeptide (TPR) repeat protein